MKCNHQNQFTLYRRGPAAQGSKFIPWGKACGRCGQAFALEPVGNLEKQQ